MATLLLLGICLSMNSFTDMFSFLSHNKPSTLYGKTFNMLCILNVHAFTALMTSGSSIAVSV